MDEIYVRQTVEAGLKDSQEGKISSVEKVRQQFGFEALRKSCIGRLQQ